MELKFMILKIITLPTILKNTQVEFLIFLTQITARVHLVKFHPDPKKFLLFSCSQDGVRCWNLRNRQYF
jgi:hypothetical protein